jgi:signal peptidase I
MVITEFFGKSMYPTLREGMRLAIEKISPDEVRPADIILYRNANSLVAHRVIRILQKGGKRAFLTKGDNHAYAGGDCIIGEDLIGRVRSAFYAEAPDADVLIKNIFIGWLYVIIGNLGLLVRANRENIPVFIRILFRPVLRAFFLGARKITHLLYSSIRP